MGLHRGLFQFFAFQWTSERSNSHELVHCRIESCKMVGNLSHKLEFQLICFVLDLLNRKLVAPHWVLSDREVAHQRSIQHHLAWRKSKQKIQVWAHVVGNQIVDRVSWECQKLWTRLQVRRLVSLHKPCMSWNEDVLAKTINLHARNSVHVLRQLCLLG